MKIEQKIIASNVFNLALIILIGFFAFQSMNLVLTKLRFVEIADDLNASFLEMRLSEKNYFLYHDRTALADIREKIDKTMQSIEAVSGDITRAIGKTDLEQLKADLKTYSDIIEKVGNGASGSPGTAAELRSAGKKLKEFSDTITHLERKRVNDIIATSKNLMLYSFAAVLLLVIVASHFISQRIIRSLRQIEKLTKTISGGNFHTIEGEILNDELGSVIRAVNSMSEELKNREEEIIQSKKLASMGVLLAGVAHEVTNPLNNISMIAQTYQELYEKLSPANRIDFMKKVDEETERIRKIVRNLLDFSRPKEPDLRETDMNTVIRKTLTLVQNMLDVSNIEVKMNLNERLPHVRIDEHQIQQVLVNLITNAVQAMPHGGTIYLSSRPGGSDHSVETTVMDSGKGISAEYLPHIFDPFFTTKGDTGTGLGLSVSYGIIKNHRGDIRVESKVGTGSTFTIELPIYERKEQVHG
jgi:two-component system NtrC family sensor kinase